MVKNRNAIRSILATVGCLLITFFAIVRRQPSRRRPSTMAGRLSSVVCSAVLLVLVPAPSGAGPSRLLAEGGAITTSGLYRVHTFTSNGTFQVLAGGGEFEVLVVAGGGGGACGNDGIAGGGGAGGVLYTNGIILTGSYPVIVGQGGAGGTLADIPRGGFNGSNSSFAGLTAIGGGHGSKYGTYATNAGNGGSGGGGCWQDTNFPAAGGSGMVGQGHDGGTGYMVGPNWPGGGGGGAGTVGSNGASTAGGAGGDGIEYPQFASVCGSPPGWFGGGGGAGAYSGSLDTPGAGGKGGGGAGARIGNGTSGVPNTGGGGGSSGSVGAPNNAGNGGSGIVIVRYSNLPFFPGPAWWYDRGAVDTNLPANDFVPITLGQLKWLALNAYYEMDANFGAGPEVAQVVNAFGNAGNFTVATIGQVKYVAQPFYDRLYQLNLTNTFPANMPGYYPWGNAPQTNDFAPALIGQAKYVFSFDSAVDSDADGLSDWREAGLGTNPYDPDSDDDGLSDGWEVEHGTNPLNWDTDGDGLSDAWEVAHGKNPLDPNDAEPELTNMREGTRERIVYHWRLYYGSTLVFTNPPGSAADLLDLNKALNALSDKFYKVE